MLNTPGHKGNTNQKYFRSWVPVAQACNPSYSGGRDQEDCGSKPAWANSFQDTFLKKPFTKKGWNKRPKIICSPSYADIRSRANTTRGLDFEHMIKQEHTREG
jgi:hypothetical protein